MSSMMDASRFSTGTGVFRYVAATVFDTEVELITIS